MQHLSRFVELNQSLRDLSIDLEQGLSLIQIRDNSFDLSFGLSLLLRQLDCFICEMANT